MIGPSYVGGKVFKNCFDLLQVKGGKFVRVYPKKPGNVRLQGVERRHREGEPGGLVSGP